MIKPNLAFNNLQWLICHKPNQKPNYSPSSFEQTGLLNFGMTTGLETKYKFKTVKLR